MQTADAIRKHVQLIGSKVEGNQDAEEESFSSKIKHKGQFVDAEKLPSQIWMATTAIYSDGNEASKFIWSMCIQTGKVS
ncbi:hypothetical protein T265_02280 [Opisthorchis viverrini]|uniref:Uncharacterized protein n=1 Tax=Opisthorchis viverrini TaxID=6198 RepID=A0A074ZZS0_OPIVI|nr:hypothetical protein T265_02280 [Opisthorchis viverrini]KER31512.1 hypothetical protein T265_02280 [Opisthorchis viverrini]